MTSVRKIETEVTFKNKPKHTVIYIPVYMFETVIVVPKTKLKLTVPYTKILSQMRTKLRDWAVWQARAGC